MEHRRSFAFRTGTVQNHLSHIKAYLRFCIAFGMVDFPASGNTLSLFAEFLCRTFISPSSVTNALSSIRFYHLLLGFSVLGFDSFHFALTKRALARTIRHLAKQAEPITPLILDRICDWSLNLGVKGLAFRALCLVAFSTLARLSSLVPVNSQCPDISRCVVISDISVNSNGFQILLKFSKTLQDLENKMTLPIVKSQRSAKSCPVIAVSSLLLKLLPGAHPSTPLFAWPNYVNGLTYLKFFTVSEARAWLMRCMQDLGLESQNFTFHSFRRGGCQYGFSKGATINDLKALGGWSSDAITAYLPITLAQLRAARAVAN